MVRALLKRLLSKPFRRGAAEPSSSAAPVAPPAPVLPPPDADGYVAVAPEGDVVVGRARQSAVGPYTVAVFRTEDGLFAVDNACLHEDGPLGEGRVSGNIVTCPYHDWRYDVRDGSCLSRKGRKLATYEVRERGGFVWVGPRKTGGTDARGGEHDDGLAQRR